MTKKDQPFPIRQRPEVEGLGFRPKVSKREPQGWLGVFLSSLIETMGSLRDRKTPRPPLWELLLVVSLVQSSDACKNLPNPGF